MLFWRFLQLLILWKCLLWNNLNLPRDLRIPGYLRPGFLNLVLNQINVLILHIYLKVLNQINGAVMAKLWGSKEK